MSDIPAKRANVHPDDIVDENFTGGLRSEDYLEMVRNGSASRKLARLIERVESVMLTMENYHPWRDWLAASVKEAREP